MPRSLKIYHDNQRGFTLTEAAIVLGLIGIVLGAVWVAAGQVWSSSRGGQISSQIITVAQNMREYYGPIGGLQSCTLNYTGIVDDDDRRLIPIDMRSEPRTERRAINHAVGSRTGDANSGTFRIQCNSSTSFRIMVRDLNRENCIRLLRTFPVLTQTLGVTRMAGPSGNANIDVLNITSPSTIPIPLSLSTAGSWCSSVTSNEVSFDFKLLN